MQVVVNFELSSLINYSKLLITQTNQEMRYRLIGTPDKSRTSSYDFSKKKISLAPAESDAEGGGSGGGAPRSAGTEGGSGSGAGGGGDPATPGTPPPSIPIPGSNNQNTLFGVCPSDIDKYSRVVFPVGFTCFLIR